MSLSQEKIKKSNLCWSEMSPFGVMGFKVFGFGLGGFFLIFIFRFYARNIDQRARFQERKLFRPLSHTYLAGKIINHLLYKLLVISIISAVEITKVFYYPWICVKNIRSQITFTISHESHPQIVDVTVKTNYEQRGQWGPAEDLS